jgi:hypothetical protein
MADEDVPDPAAQPRPAEEDRPLWTLSRDDQRLLWVTFVGGVASFLVGAGLIGVALTLARLVVHSKSYIQLVTVGSIFLLLAVVDFVLRAWARHIRLPLSPLPPGLRYLIYGVAGIVILVFIGVAAQVK